MTGSGAPTTQSDEQRLRLAIVAVMVSMQGQGLNRGTSGNVSTRCDAGMLITPSGVAPDALIPDAVVKIEFGDTVPAAGHGWRPSSEWRMHAGVYARRPDVQAVVHCHSRYATIGQIVAAPSLARALSIAEEVEEQAAVYVGTLQIGGPNLLSPEDMEAVFDRFRDYGQVRSDPA